MKYSVRLNWGAGSQGASPTTNGQEPAPAQTNIDNGQSSNGTNQPPKDTEVTKENIAQEKRSFWGGGGGGGDVGGGSTITK